VRAMARTLALRKTVADAAVSLDLGSALLAIT
jgi:hypothetical protein